MAKKQRFAPGWQSVTIGTLGGFMLATGMFGFDEPTILEAEPVTVELELVDSPDVQIGEPATIERDPIGRTMSKGFDR